MKIKEKILKEVLHEGIISGESEQERLGDVCEKAIDLTLAKVGKVIDEWAEEKGLKQDGMPNIAYEELNDSLGQ